MAVNCFVTEPRRNRVSGVFGMPFASSAMPMPSANKRSPSRLTSADPLKSVPRISLNWEARSGAAVGVPSTDASGEDGAAGMVLAVGGATAAVDDGGAGALVEEQPARPSTRARTAVANLIETPRAATGDTGSSDHCGAIREPRRRSHDAGLLGVYRLRAQPSAAAVLGMRILPGMPMWSAPLSQHLPLRPVAGSRGSIRHPTLAGKRKVTFTVVPAGTTFGVADPTSRNLPSSPSATNRVAGSELWLSTVMVQLRAFGGTGPSAGGSGVGTGVGLGRPTGSGGGPREGRQRRQRHAGRDVQLGRAIRNALALVVAVAATCHEDRAVEQERERGRSRQRIGACSRRSSTTRCAGRTGTAAAVQAGSSAVRSSARCHPTAVSWRGS